MDWQRLGSLARRGWRAARAFSNDAMAKVERKVVTPDVELGLALEQIATDRAAINREAVQLTAQTIQLQRQQQQLRTDINTTNTRIEALLRAGDLDQAVVLGGVLQKQQAELQEVTNRLWQAANRAKLITVARNTALQQLEDRRREIQDLQAKLPATAAMDTITAALNRAEAAPLATEAMAHIDALAAMPDQQLDTAVAEFEADAILRRLRAEQLLRDTPATAEAPAVEKPIIKTMGGVTRRGFTLIELMIVMVIIIIIGTVIFNAATGDNSTSGGCAAGPDDQTAIDAMEALGFSDVSVTSSGSAWGECGEDDHYVFHMAGTNSAGKHVDNAIVCAGPWKGATVRFVRQQD